MNKIQKVGGYATLVLGVQYLVLAVLMSGGLNDFFSDGNRNTYMIRQTMIEALSEAELQSLEEKGLSVEIDDFYFSPTKNRIEHVIGMLFAITFLLSALALRERLHADAPNRIQIATMATSVGSTLFLAYAIISLIGLPGVFFIKDISALRMLTMVTYGLSHAAIFAYGWTTFLWGWAGLSTKKLPSGLCYALLLAGLFAILIGFIDRNPVMFDPLAMAVNMVWAVWLGYLLLSRESTQPRF